MKLTVRCVKLLLDCKNRQHDDSYAFYPLLYLIDLLLYLIDLVVTGSRADRAYRKRKRQRPSSLAINH